MRDEKAQGAAAANEGLLVWVGGGLVPRDMAKVCVDLGPVLLFVATMVNGSVCKTNKK